MNEQQSQPPPDKVAKERVVEQDQGISPERRGSPEQPRAIPLLDERAFGEAPIAYEGRSRMLDASARRSLLLREAASGTLWTSRAAAERCGVTQVTALADLSALVREGTLRVDGAGRKRRYRAG